MVHLEHCQMLIKKTINEKYSLGIFKSEWNGLNLSAINGNDFLKGTNYLFKVIFTQQIYSCPKANPKLPHIFFHKRCSHILVLHLFLFSGFRLLSGNRYLQIWLGQKEG